MTTLAPAAPVAITLASLPFLLAAFQGLVLALVLWIRPATDEPSGNTANRLLSGLLLVLSLMLIDHAADSSGHFMYAPWLMEAVVPLYFSIGPLLWGVRQDQDQPRPGASGVSRFSASSAGTVATAGSTTVPAQQRDRCENSEPL